MLKRIKIFKCKKCSCCFLRQKEYAFHKLKHVKPIMTEYTPNANNGLKTHFECKECGWRFVKETTLKTHLIVHEPFPHICECGIGYYLEKDLQAHKEIMHPKRKKPIWKGTINYTGPKQTGIGSEFCIKPKENRNEVKRKLARSNRKLKTKGVRVQTNKEDRKCLVCEKTFDSKFRRDDHYNSVHMGLRLYPCEICNKNFAQMASLYTHLKTHTGIKNFVCSYCDRRFLAKANLKTHLRIHTGEKPFVCDYCKMKFSDPSALARHVRLHTGVKPYACEKCNMRFSDASAMRGHRLRQSCTVRRKKTRRIYRRKYEVIGNKKEDNETV
ncbi:zinc finger protein 91-like isoform X2 [Achroia grisella]|nr:zinc finger protein 91-like isoform X2 [Achroia grisella]